MKPIFSAGKISAIGLLTLAAASAQAASVISVEASSAGVITGLSTNTGTTGATIGTAWTITETMNDPGHGHLQFTGTNSDPLGVNNPTGSGHAFGKWISKTVVNNTAVTWTTFELELQAVLGTPSGQGDGLSFADGSALTASFVSDQFATYTRQELTRDYLNFSGGDVLPGESVTFSFVISDNSNNNPFYLLQTANKTELPEPASLGLVGMALAGLGLSRRRKPARS